MVDEGGEVSRAELQALKTSLASLGGGGLGEQDVIDLINIYAPNSGPSAGLDSARVLELIGDSYVSSLLNILATQSPVTFGSPDSAGDVTNIYNVLNVDSSDTFITNNNLYTTLNIDSGDQIITNSGGDSNSIWTILNVDSSDTFLTLENIDSLGLTYTDSDVIDLLNDSGVQNIMPQLDSTYDLGDSSRRWRDLWLSGNTINLGSLSVKSGGDSGTGLYVNGRRLAYSDSVPDSASGTNGLDSAAVITLIDSAGILDSSQITALIDSALLGDHCTHRFRTGFNRTILHDCGS